MDNKVESLFFIAISPAYPLQERIHEIKSDIYQKYGTKGSFRSPAHITLQMPFKKKLNKIEGLLKDLNLFAISKHPFQIQLDGFGSFEPRVVFIKVVENTTLIELQKQLEKRLKLHQIFGSNYREEAFNPHITVAYRDLKKEQFYPLWEDYKLKTFKESFIADGIHLYKHSGKKWEEYKYFPFTTH